MAALLNVQNNIMYLDSLSQRYKLLYPKLSSLSDDERREVESIKKETLETLGQVFAMNLDELLKDNFSSKVSLISQGINSVLNEKIEELNKAQDENKKAENIIEDIAKSVCKLETLDSNIALRFDIEKILFYLKNKVSGISAIDKKLYALEYLREKLDSYKIGMYKLIILARKHESKNELSFDDKQEIFDAISSVSFEYHYDSNHSKVFNEDLKDISVNLNTSDYIVWMENIFVELLKVVGVNIEYFTDNLLALVTDEKVTKTNIENYITFLGKKYDSDIVSYYDSLVQKKIDNVKEIRDVIRNSFIYEQNKDYKFILTKINKNHRLPEMLVDSRYKKYLENVLFGYSFPDNIEDEIESIIDEVATVMFEKFDPEKYLDIYNYNSKQKNKQIGLFKDYLDDLLAKSKDILREKYIVELENKIEENMLKEYNTTQAIESSKKRQRDIEMLKRAAANVKERYSIFDEYCYMKYISSVERAYSVEGLNAEVSIRRKSIFSGSKGKNLNKKDVEYVSDFLKSPELTKELVRILTYDIIVGNDTIRYEVLSKIIG
ncbi:MAG: hypothetical protein IJ809_02015 [Clostridia bacterium]|nr:hypothetical protein [Clostridia bacterium]